MVEALIGGLIVDGGFSGIEPQLYLFDVFFEALLQEVHQGVQLPSEPYVLL